MEIIKSFIYQCISLPETEVFDKLMEKINDYTHNINLNNMGSIKSYKGNKNKIKGDIFEIICLNMIKNNSFKNINAKNVWLFKELPLDISIFLGFKHKIDKGIDIIVQTVDNNWLAVQCKYRSKPKNTKVNIGNGKTIYKKWQVNWDELSTFYSLCDRTGPENYGWYKHVVITTAEFVGREGRKNEKDLSICLGTFRGLIKDEWFKLLGDTGNKLESNTSNIIEEKLDNTTKFIIDMSKLNLENNTKLDLNLIREKRLLALTKINK
jgi:hypothetical protein